MVIKGSKLSEEHKRKIGDSLRGRKSKGPSEETRKRMSESKKRLFKEGKIKGVFKKGNTPWIKGKKHMEKTIEKLSGKNHYHWAGGKKRYWQKKARKLMFERGFNIEGLQVHHINHNILDNRLENIKLLTIQEHGRIHGKESKRGNRA